MTRPSKLGEYHHNFRFVVLKHVFFDSYRLQISSSDAIFDINNAHKMLHLSDISDVEIESGTWGSTRHSGSGPGCPRACRSCS